jgi:glycosyltransferase EpsF
MNANKLKVLHVTGAMNRGGAEVMLMDIFRHISPDIHFDFLVNYKKKQGIVKGDFDDEIVERGAAIKHIATQWDLGPVRYIRRFKKIYNELGKPNVVHIHLNAKSGIIALAAKLAGASKIIVHSHANLQFRGSKLRVLFETMELQFQKILIYFFATDYWGASVEANKSLFYSNIAKNKAKVINNAVAVGTFQQVTIKQITAFRESLNISTNTLLLGNVGRIVKHKNVSFVIDILKELTTENIDCCFVFAGRIDDAAYMQEIQQKIKAHNLEKKVIHLGNRNDIPIIVNALDVFVAPALKEGFGLVAVEAQAAGIPCVLYKGFPKSVDMQLNLVTFLNTFEVSKWVSAVLAAKDKKRTDKKVILNNITTLGFDIVGNTKQLEDLYKS